jgi:hypothetical protein
VVVTRNALKWLSYGLSEPKRKKKKLLMCGSLNGGIDMMLFSFSALCISFSLPPLSSTPSVH